MRILIGILCLCLSLNIAAQKKVLQHDDKAIWNGIKNVSISNSGDYVLYALEKGEKDQTIHLVDIDGQPIMSHQRSKGGQFTYDSKYAVFAVNAWKDSIREMKRRKVKEKKLPKDTLIIYNMEAKSVAKIPNVKSYQLPEKWSGIVTYMLEPSKPVKKDSSKTKEKDSTQTKTKLKKISKDNGFHLVIRQLVSGVEDTLKFVHHYKTARLK